MFDFFTDLLLMRNFFALRWRSYFYTYAIISPTRDSATPERGQMICSSSAEDLQRNQRNPNSGNRRSVVGRYCDFRLHFIFEFWLIMFVFLSLQLVYNVLLCIFILTGRDILLVRRLIEQYTLFTTLMSTWRKSRRDEVMGAIGEWNV